jgi:hypothetical protein
MAKTRVIIYSADPDSKPIEFDTQYQWVRAIKKSFHLEIEEVRDCLLISANEHLASVLYYLLPNYKSIGNYRGAGKALRILEKIHPQLHFAHMNVVKKTRTEQALYLYSMFGELECKIFNRIIYVGPGPDLSSIECFKRTIPPHDELIPLEVIDGRIC